MKKWLNVLGIIGVATTSTTAIVACQSSESVLSKSFSSRYQVDSSINKKIVTDADRKDHTSNSSNCTIFN